MRPEYEMEELVPIVGRLAEKYTAFESTSLPYEKAAQLMEAVLYCTREAEPSGGESALSPGRLSAQQAYEAGLARVKQKTRLALDRYNSILRNFVSYGNHCLEDTFLRGLPEFFKWYDPVFEPQNTILTLDYPVLKDLSGSTGIDRIHEWLCCVGLEQSFLEKFPESLVRCILEKYSHLYEELADNLQKLVRYIFRAENLLVDYTAEPEGLQEIAPLIEKFKSGLYTDAVDRPGYDPVPVKKNEGFMSAAQIQYVCRAGNFVRKGLPYHGALRVLRVLMGYDYLWTQVRVKGGAYGCMCNFGKSGESYFVSYRDPNLEKTIDVYEKAADHIAGFEADERTMTQYIIGALSELDMPLTPSAKGMYSLTGYMTHYEYEQLQKNREELLSADADTIRKLAVYIRAFIEDDYLCVVGNEEKIKENAERFGEIAYLFH